ncbi:6-bladed beta-propeller [Puteibacter caeruleilacunae]|nr:6-bladed beta-propeller [Puteibacter caeruleilacunae]
MKILVKMMACFIVVVVCGQSCKQTDSTYTTIKIDPTEKNNGTKVSLEIDTIISLETCDASLIGRIEKVEYYKSKYYVLDEYHTKTVFVFDSIGKFLNKTIKGRGPGEIAGTSCLDIDRVNDEVRILDHITYNLNFYDQDLNFKRRFRYYNVIRSFVGINDSMNLAFVRISVKKDDEIGKPQSYNYAIYDDSLSVVLDKIGPLRRKLANVHVAIPMSKFGNEILYSCIYKYDIFSLKNKTRELKYKIDFGEYALTEEDLDKGMDYVWNCRIENKKIIALMFLFHNKEFVTFGYPFNNRMSWCIISKSNGRKIHSNDYTEQEFPIAKIVGVFSSDKFIACVNPKDMRKFLIQNNKDEEASKIKDIDNPYLVVFKPNIDGNS